MTKKFFLSALSILFSVSCAFAQNEDDIKRALCEKYEQESIWLGTGSFYKGEKRYSAFFNYGKLKKEIADSPSAMLEFNRYREKQGIATILSTVGLGALIAALFVPDNPELQSGLLLGAVGTTVASIPLSVQSSNHLQKSVWSYNRDLLLPEGDRRGK